VPVIVTAHHDTDVWMGRRHRLLEQVTARLSDRIVTCSDAVGRYAVETLRLPAAKVCTLRNAIEIDPQRGSEEDRLRLRRAFGAEEGDLLVGTLGRLQEPKKGLTHFLTAAAKVAAEKPRARFVLVGDGPSRAILERQAAALGIAARTHFAGPRRDVGAAMAAFDLFVQPSLWEGFGLTLLEAMAARRPIVASRVGGVPEVVRDDREGLLVPAGDPDACAGAMITLLNDPERARRYGEAGRARVLAEFGIDRLASETATLYRQLLERPGASGRAASVSAAAPPAERRGRAA
jgi:glycosyltransferase involved in cell wall biosynthesis